MFNHQYDFQIEIPNQLISDKKHDKIFEELLENKVIIGLCGYGKSGKDTIAKKFINNYRFHRVAFADNIKRELNEHLKEAVYQDILKGDIEHFLDDKFGIHKPEDIDFFTENLELKKIVRPYIIWYGEKLREVNGEYYWINKAMEIDAIGHDNIILTDVRRTKELDIFMWSNSFKRRSELGFASAGLSEFSDNKTKPYSTLLFHVSQFNLKDKDVLTHECIRIAQERWLFDHTFYVDPRLPEAGPYRNNSTNFHVKEVAKKFGINKPDPTIAYGRQTSILD